MSQETRARSIARGSRGVTVAPSPYNQVKLEAVLLLLGAALAWWLVELWTSRAVQLLALAGYGAAAAGWIILRTRAVGRRAHTGSDD